MPPFLLNFIRGFHCRYCRHCRNNKASIVVLSQQKFTRQYAQVYLQCSPQSWLHNFMQPFSWHCSLSQALDFLNKLFLQGMMHLTGEHTHLTWTILMTILLIAPTIAPLLDKTMPQTSSRWITQDKVHFLYFLYIFEDKTSLSHTWKWCFILETFILKTFILTTFIL